MKYEIFYNYPVIVQSVFRPNGVNFLRPASCPVLLCHHHITVQIVAVRWFVVSCGQTVD